MPRLPICRSSFPVVTNSRVHSSFVVCGGEPLPFSIADHNTLSHQLSQAWQPNTLVTYGLGLQAYHRFCDSHHIPEGTRAPASADLIVAFTSHLIGRVAASTVKNYVAGVRAWHLQHRLPWLVNDTEYHLLLRSATVLAPPTSTRSI